MVKETVANWQALRNKARQLKEKFSDENVESSGNQLIMNLKLSSEQYRNEIDRLRDRLGEMLNSTEKEIQERGIGREVVLSFGQNQEGNEQHGMDMRKAKASAFAKQSKSQLILKFKKYIEGKHMEDIRRELQEGRDPEIEVCREPVRKDLEESYETDLNDTVRIKSYQEILSSFRYIFDEGEIPEFEKDLHPSEKKYDTEVRAKQFEALPKDPERPDCITKETLHNFLASYKYTMVFYNIDPATVREEVDYLQTESKGLVTLQEFHQFLTESRETVDYQKYLGISRTQSTARLEPTFVGEQAAWNIIDRIFQEINYFGDVEISQQQLGRKLGEELQRAKLIQKPAVLLPKIGRHVYFYQILFEIENSLDIKTWTLPALKSYLANYYTLRVGDRYDLLQKLIILGRCPNQKIILLRKQPYELVKRVYEACEKFEGNYIMKRHFVDRINGSELFKELQNTKVRTETSWGIEEEDFRDIIERLHEEADEFINFDELLDFFSQGGRPKHLFNIMHEKLFIKNIGEQEGTKKGSRAATNSKRGELISTPTIQKIKSKFLNQNITVPLPFKLHKQQPRAIPQVPEPAPFVFKHKPIPDVCKSVNLYTHMVNEQNRKRQMRQNELKHQNRMEKVRPFSLSKSKGVVHCQSDIEPFVFKANPVPESTLQPRYEQILRDKERKRQQLREEAENSLKMPQAIKNMMIRDYEFRQRRKRKPMPQEKGKRTSPRSKPVPDFKRLQLQFEEQLNQRKKEYRPTSPIHMNLLERPPCSKRHLLTEQFEKHRKPSKEREQNLKRSSSAANLQNIRLVHESIMREAERSKGSQMSKQSIRHSDALLEQAFDFVKK